MAVLTFDSFKPEQGTGELELNSSINSNGDRERAILVTTDAINPHQEGFHSIFDHFKPPYSFDQASQILAYHQAVAAAYDLRHPYFRYTDRLGAEPNIHKPYGALAVRGGEVGSFSALQMAAIINAQMKTYITKGTMGKDFPLGDPFVVEELTAIMIDNFGPTTYCTVIESYIGDVYIPVAVVRANIGNTLGLLSHHIGDESSNLPPLASLSFPAELLDESIANIPCTRIASLSRFALNEETFRELGASRLEYPTISKDLLAGMGQVLEIHNQSRAEPILIVVIDTHIDAVKKMMERVFKAVEVVGPNHRLPNNRPMIQPTLSASKSVLGYHYGQRDGENSSSIPGYRDQISLMIMRFNDFVHGGTKNL